MNTIQDVVYYSHISTLASDLSSDFYILLFLSVTQIDLRSHTFHRVAHNGEWLLVLDWFPIDPPLYCCWSPLYFFHSHKGY